MRKVIGAKVRAQITKDTSATSGEYPLIDQAASLWTHLSFPFVSHAATPLISAFYLDSTSYSTILLHPSQSPLATTSASNEAEAKTRPALFVPRIYYTTPIRRILPSSSTCAK